jgi:hypothetical protein
MLKPPNETTFVVVKKINEAFRSYEGGVTDARMVGFHFNTSWGVFFFHIHFHLHCLWPRGLFHSFFLCEKIILGFAISFVKHFKELY